MHVDNSENSTICGVGATFSQRDLKKKETRKYEKAFNIGIDWQAATIRCDSFPFAAEHSEV